MFHFPDFFPTVYLPMITALIALRFVIVVINLIWALVDAPTFHVSGVVCSIFVLVASSISLATTANAPDAKVTGKVKST